MSLKRKLKKDSNRKENFLLFIGIIITIISIIWIINETNERKVYINGTATVLSNKTKRDEIDVQYSYAFDDISSTIVVPKLVNPKIDDTIKVMIKKDNLEIAKYGIDSTFYAIILSIIGIAFIFVSILKVQSKEEVRKIKDYKTLRMYKNITH